MCITEILMLLIFLCDASLCAVVVTASCVKQIAELCENLVVYLVFALFRKLGHPLSDKRIVHIRKQEQKPFKV